MPSPLSLFSKAALPLAMTVAVATFVLPPANPATPTAGPEAKGGVEKIKVHGKSLEENLEGDSPDRDVFVYLLPPSYAKERNRRYPVVYFLHGYSVDAERYWKLMTVTESADKLKAAGTTREMILVHPDAFTVYDGSMYSNSPTTGDWEDYIAQDLVAYIDSHYRTLAGRESRGLAGHSMGGYGTIRIGMKHPEVFSVLYPMSSCCLMNNNPRPGQGQGTPARPAGDAANGGETKQPARNPFAKAMLAESAAWSPNPMNPPQFFDLPEKDGQVQPLVVAKWHANSPLVIVDQYVPNLKKYRAIAMECGLQDGLLASNKDLDQALVRLGVAHTFETYEGDHVNRVKDRFESKVLPFFSENLTFPARKAK
jgi:enterochelin esterase-like enzyme